MLVHSTHSFLKKYLFSLKTEMAETINEQCQYVIKH